MANISFAKKSNQESPENRKVYKILIVDDDRSVHEITNIALKGMTFSDFQIEIISVYSGKEAQELLHKQSNIALALIDVVMETPEAGLELVNFIRNTLQNKLMRLIIRTGQANDFPQMHVIQHYDINDFKEKTELTLERLYTTVRSSIKQFEQLHELQNKYDETYAQMTTNSLTMLPNRIKLLEDFSHQSNQTLILIDIIGFSIINDTYGYDVGDFVLKELGAFLFSMYSQNFRVYHLNNDLFALVTTEEDMHSLVQTVANIKEDISKLNLITNNFNNTIETTIGVAYQTQEDVIRKAELALKEARNSGRNQIKYYSDDLKIIQQRSNTNHWTPIIKEALENNRLIAYAQPIYNLHDNTIIKYELLVRLEHEDVIYTPYHFLEAAQNSGYLYNIFKFMFREACRLVKERGERYSVNIGDCEFHQYDLVDFIKSTIEEFAIDPSYICVEILEYNAISHSDDIKETIEKIHKLGIEFVIDDFGVQCSNFAQTTFIPVSTLKIDGSFIQNLDDSFESQVVVKTIQTFAQGMNLEIIAEFVCDEKVYNKVKELGINYGQGYYLGEPKSCLV